jgi:sugar lactone lactonase YvrE
LWDGKGAKKQIIKSFNDEVLNFNDSITGPDGCIYAGTYYWDAGRMSKHGKLYRIKPDYSMETLDDGIELSNGMAFSPDNSLFYYADSARRNIYVYDFKLETGSLSNKRIFVKSGAGIPDGITVDSTGYIWCAMWYEGVVRRYAPDGAEERIIHFPVKQVSSVTFGGENLDILFVTSAKSLFRGSLMPPNFNNSVDMGGPLYCVRVPFDGISENRADFSHNPRQSLS